MAIIVFLKNGHREQFRAHLRKTKPGGFEELPTMTCLFFPNARIRNIEQTIRKTVPNGFGGDTSIGPY